MVYSTDRSKAVIPALVLLFVALWFILRGDLFYVLPCVILFLCFSVLLALRLPRLGRESLSWCFLYVCSICACLGLSVSQGLTNKKKIHLPTGQVNFFFTCPAQIPTCPGFVRLKFLYAQDLQTEIEVPLLTLR